MQPFMKMSFNIPLVYYCYESITKLNLLLQKSKHTDKLVLLSRDLGELFNSLCLYSTFSQPKEKLSK